MFVISVISVMLMTIKFVVKLMNGEPEQSQASAGHLNDTWRRERKLESISIREAILLLTLRQSLPANKIQRREHKVAATCRTNCTFDILVGLSFIQRRPSPISPSPLSLRSWSCTNQQCVTICNHKYAKWYPNTYWSVAVCSYLRLALCQFQMFCNLGSDARGLGTFHPDGQHAAGRQKIAE